jgi:hypothetical protein
MLTMRHISGVASIGMVPRVQAQFRARQHRSDRSWTSRPPAVQRWRARRTCGAVRRQSWDRRSPSRDDRCVTARSHRSMALSSRKHAQARAATTARDKDPYLVVGACRTVACSPVSRPGWCRLRSLCYRWCQSWESWNSLGLADLRRMALRDFAPTSSAIDFAAWNDSVVLGRPSRDREAPQGNTIMIPS